VTPKELAEILNGREYGEEMTKDEQNAAAENNLVVVFGASDDLMEFRGAIDDELGAYEGTDAWVDASGLLPTWEEVLTDANKNDIRDWLGREDAAVRIEAKWDSEGYSWTFETKIQHETFEIVEDGEKYCRGIVFSLESLQ
jgi:hypothetical protein